jgi:HSP20 family protein
MLIKKERDPFALLRQMPLDIDRFFESGWPMFTPFFRSREIDAAKWSPQVDVVERGGQLVTRVDLPGLKKEDVKVEIADGYLAISGERKREKEEKNEQFYRCEREYGSFYRAVPLPESVKLEDVKATFADGVLEVSVPLPVVVAPKARQVEIQDEPKLSKSAA